MATLPTRLVEIEFDAGVWTDVTADMVSISTQRGRNRELGAFQTGTGQLTLRNETRKYDPEYAAGTYYGKLRPNRRIRFRATYSAVTYPVMVAYIDRIAQTYDGPNAAVTTITFSDLFKILNRVELATSPYAHEVAYDAPVAWWRLGDPAGATVAAEAVSGAWPLSPVGTPTFGTTSLSINEPDTAATFPTFNDGLFGVFPAGSFPLTTAATLEWIFKYTSGAVGTNGFEIATIGGTASGVQILISGGVLQVAFVNNAGTSYAVNSTGVNVSDGNTYHIMVTGVAGSNIKIYVDGVDRTASAVTFTGSMANTTTKWVATLGAVNYPPYILQGLPSINDEAAVYTTALSAARAAAHSAASKIAWRGDLPGVRAGRILDRAAVAAGDRSLDTGSASLASATIAGPALSYLQKLETTELGELFVTRDGKVRLLGRRESQQGTYLTSQATLADATPAAGEVAYRDVSFDVDESTIIDRATVSRAGGLAVTYSNAAAITEFQILDATYDGLLHDTDAYSSDYAQWIVNTHRTPSSRSGAVLLALPVDPANTYPKILGLELGDRITLKRRPKIGAAITYDYRVEAVSHDTGGAYWNTHLQLSPFNLGASGYPVFIWDVTKWDQHVWGI